MSDKIDIKLADGLIMPSEFDLMRGLACFGYYKRNDMASPECTVDCEYKQACIIISKLLSDKYFKGAKAEHDRLTVQHEQELRDAVEGARKGERERVLKIIERGKDQLDECLTEGFSSKIIIAKQDVLAWVRQEIESHRSTVSNPGEQQDMSPESTDPKNVSKNPGKIDTLPGGLPEGGTDVMR